MREIRTSGSVGASGWQHPEATRQLGGSAASFFVKEPS